LLFRGSAKKKFIDKISIARSNENWEIILDSEGNVVIRYSYTGGITPVSMNVNGMDYYYLKNAQGDITHIVDGDVNEVASYEYDAWGNHTHNWGHRPMELISFIW